MTATQVRPTRALRQAPLLSLPPSRRGLWTHIGGGRGVLRAEEINDEVSMNSLRLGGVGRVAAGCLGGPAFPGVGRVI